MNETSVEKAKHIIQSNVYMTIATSIIEEQSGYSRAMPWSTPVYYAFDPRYHFYWYSGKHTKHSQSICLNPCVAVSIFDSNASEEDAGGVYIVGRAAEVRKEELSEAMHIYFCRALADDSNERERMTEASEDFLDNSVLRMYKMLPDQFFVSNDAAKWHGKWLDSRSEILLTEIVS